MPVSIDLLSPPGPRNAGQSSPAFRVPRSGTSRELAFEGLESEGLESEELAPDDLSPDERAPAELDFEELGASFAAAKHPKQQKTSRDAEREILGMSGEPRRQGGTLTDII